MIYPNPTKGYVKVDSKSLGSVELTIEIFDLLSNQVFSLNTKAICNQVALYLPDYLINGVYFIKLSDFNSGSTLLFNSLIINR